MIDALVCTTAQSHAAPECAFLSNMRSKMARLLRPFILLLALGAALPAAGAGSPLTAEKMWSLGRVAEPAISPDGRLAVVPVTRYDIGDNKGLTDLWLQPTTGGAARQLTSGSSPDTQPAFSPDGRWIAFVSKRGKDEQTQIYVIAVDGGEALRVTNVPTGVSVPKWFPDSRRIAFVSSIWTDLAGWEAQGKRLKEREDSKMSAKVWDRAPIAYWDHLVDDREPHLFAIDRSGGEPLAITRYSGYSLSRQEYNGFSYDISPDGREVAYAANIDRTGIEPNFDVIVLPACGCQPARDITSDNPANDASPRYSPDGRYLAFTQQRIRGFYADRSRLMLYERATGRTRNLTEAWDRSVTDPVWLPDGRALLAAVDDAATQRVYRFEPNGSAPKAVTTTPSFSALAVGKSATVGLRQSFSEPPTLVRLDLRSGRATKLSTFNDAALADVAFGRVASVSYKGAHDDDIQMWVIYPPDFDPAKKYPVYMLLHGGPHNAMTDGTQWRWNAHVFAGWGYIVTWHNFHGSSGFGQAFTDSINPDWVSMPYEDTIKAAGWLMEQPYVDRDRMAAGGGSYGGFLATVLLGREHPFKTIVAHAAVYNSYTQIASDYGADKPRFFSFWERPDEFARYSPATAAANFKTPTLIIHGQLDRRVPVNHGIELFNTLQSKGIPSKLVYFPDENHWVLKPQNSLFWYRTKQEWLAQYVVAGGK
jgi:dipeptidyl aminopeptidase/acylaminoacyl peptidase